MAARARAVGRRARRPGQRRHARSSALAERLYDELGAAGLDVLYDDRDAGPGEKFADAELLGCPLRVTVGPARRCRGGELEVQMRRGRETESVPLEGAAEAVAALWRTLP